MTAIPNSKRTLWELLVRSITENDRISPRLLTVFVFVFAAVALLARGAFKQPQVVNGIVLSSWPPEYIWSGLLLLIAGLLGLGKVTEALVTRSKIQADAQVATAELTGQTPGAPATATTITTTELSNQPML